MTRLLPHSVADYRPHEMHSTGRIWDQTNCAVDVWIEVLHALELDPVAAAAFAVAADFEGDQWTFYKYPLEDLRRVYGIDVHEMIAWRGVLVHVVEQLELGRLMTVEADSWFLPDTHGVAYRTTHDKSTIVVNEVDVEARTMAYFHNSGYHALSGEDFDGVFRLGAHADPAALPPYTEIVRLERVQVLDDATLTATARDLLAQHLARRPDDNPVVRMGARIDADVPWLQSSEPATFHQFAFATVRQCGASAETAASFCLWLADRSPEDGPLLKEAAGHWTELASAAKAVQLKLARVARGRTTSLEESWQAMASHWESAQHCLDAVVR